VTKNKKEAKRQADAAIDIAKSRRYVDKWLKRDCDYCMPDGESVTFGQPPKDKERT
jgi:hypothetical protein